MQAGGIATKKIGITFSGGGFRATLFHLGVVRFLKDAGLLEGVSHITSVSGGSVMAAHLVLNWERYGAGPKGFDEAARELVDFVRWDLRGRVLRSYLSSWLFPPSWPMLWWGGWDRISLLARAYGRLFKAATLADLARPGRPELHILATSLGTGQLASFGGATIRLDSDPKSRRNAPEPDSTAPAGRIPVSLAVAASTAFPPMFPPVRVDHTTFGVDKTAFPRPHFLADGGIFDNLGIRKLLWVNRSQDVRFDLVVVSDAQREFAREYGNEYRFIWGRASRSVDLMMERLSWFENDSIRRLCQEADSQLLECRLQQPVPPGRPYALPEDVQSDARNVRTDADAFTNHEVNALVRQGEAIARLVWEEERDAGRMDLGHEPAPGPPWSPLAPKPPAPSDAFNLRRSGRRSYGLFRGSHWASYAVWTLLGVYAGLPFVFIYRTVQAESRAEANLKLQVIRTLGQLALAAADVEWLDAKVVTQDEWQVAEAAAKEAWKNAKDAWSNLENVEGVGTLLRHYKGKIQVEIDKGRLDSAAFRGVALEVGKMFRAEIESNRAAFRVRALLEGNRSTWYGEAVAAARRLAEPNDRTLTDLASTRRRFWGLYLGELVLIESPEFGSAMRDFGDRLAEWETAGEKGAVDLSRLESFKASLARAAGALDDVRKAELGPG